MVVVAVVVVVAVAAVAVAVAVAGEVAVVVFSSVVAVLVVWQEWPCSIGSRVVVVAGMVQVQQHNNISPIRKESNHCSWLLHSRSSPGCQCALLGIFCFSVALRAKENS